MKINRFQKLLHRIPWYVFGLVFSLSLLSLYSNADNSLIVILNMIICACMIWAAFHNLDYFSSKLENEESSNNYLHR